MTTVVKGTGGQVSVHCKGAAEQVLEICDKELVNDGEMPLENKDIVLKFIDSCNRKSLRSLCLAYKSIKLTD